MKIVSYNQDGKEAGEITLPKEIFGLEVNNDLVHQVVVGQRGNQRQVIAHAKDRSQVRGGGKKPWKQKGTGRARHGSIRSPLWKGGGATFGPSNERVFTKRIPKKMRRKAVMMVLSAKVKENLLIVLDKLSLDQPKAKMAQIILNNLPSKKSSCIVALPNLDKNLILALRNISSVKTMQAKELNCLDLLSYKYLIVPKESIKIIKETLSE